MLVRKYRLSKNKNFEKVFRDGRSVFSNEVGIKFLKNNLGFSRFGIIVSLKISKSAVIRNKIKRRLREIIRNHLFSLRENCDIVILTRQEIKNLDFWQIKERLEYLFKKAKLI